jgi:glycosyltransferase involved in cell wall biosynthesis
MTQNELNPAAQRPAVSIVSPCYNEEEVIGETYRRLAEVCRPYLPSCEIVLVNDGSKDSTWSAIESICQKDPSVVGVNLSRNHGHQLALTAGLSVARGARIFILDADLQDPPELLPEMMKVMDQGCDVVYGVRKKRGGETWFKLQTAALFYRLLRQVADIEIPVDTGDFRLMSRRALDVFLSMPERQRFIRGMVSWIGLRQVPLLYDRQARFAGQSKYPFTKMLRFAFDAITGFSVQPLKIAIYLGAIAGGMALLSVVYVMWSWLNGQVVAGWTSLMVVVLLMGSAQLFVMGIIGEYLGQIFLESKRRPLFVIDQIYRVEPGGTAPTTQAAIVAPGKK